MLKGEVSFGWMTVIFSFMTADDHEHWTLEVRPFYFGSMQILPGFFLPLTTSAIKHIELNRKLRNNEGQKGKLHGGGLINMIKTRALWAHKVQQTAKLVKLRKGCHLGGWAVSGWVVHVKMKHWPGRCHSLTPIPSGVQRDHRVTLALPSLFLN